MSERIERADNAGYSGTVRVADASLAAVGAFLVWEIIFNLPYGCSTSGFCSSRLRTVGPNSTS